MFSTTSDLEFLHPEVIVLEPDVIEQASRNSLRVANDSQQWEVYLNGLATLGLQQWLQRRLSTRSIDLSGSTLRQPGYAELINAVCNLTVEGFKLCVIATESIFSDIVQIPQAAVELSPFVPHFYVFVQVLEEPEEMIVRGVLRRDRLVQYLRSNRLSPQQDWIHRVPLDLFDHEPTRLIAYVEHLDPADLPLLTLSPQAGTVAMTSVNLQKILIGLSPDIPLWQQISWKQMASILMSPELATQVYRWRRQFQTGGVLPDIQPDTTTAIQKVINVAQWIESGLDELAQRLGFLTAEQFQLTSGASHSLLMSTRSMSATFDGAITALRQGGLPLPDAVRPVYREVELQDLDLCLCLLIYRSVTPTAERSSETDWSLLVIIGSQTHQYLPTGLRLQVSCDNNLLEEYTLEVEEALLYSAVNARVGEALQVKITAPSGAFYKLLPLTFAPEERSCQDDEHLI